MDISSISNSYLESKQRKVITEGGLEALLFMTKSDSIPVVVETMKVLTSLCSVSKLSRVIWYIYIYI